jgi:hypothetical protein
MNEYRFKNTMGRMIAVYGEKAYPKVRMDLIYRTVEQCDADEFDKFCDILIGNEKFAPMMEKFNEFRVTDRTRRSIAERSELVQRMEMGKACRFCADDGRVIAIKRSDKSTWAFLCSYCEKGNRFRELSAAPKGEPFVRIATWKAELAESFALLDQMPALMAAHVNEGI